MSDTEAPEALTGNLFQGSVSATEGGVVNAFGGDQHNLYLSVSALRRRIRYASDPDLQHRELRMVVPPPDLERDLTVLDRTRLLVLAGGARTGLTTAACQRWQAFAATNPGRRVEELFSADHSELVDELDDLKQPSVLLLDISHDHDLATRFVERLAQVQTALRESDSHLVVAIGDTSRPVAERALPESVHRVGRPDPAAVMAKRMRHPELLHRLQRDPRFLELTADQWPPRAVQIAEVIDSAPPGSGMDELIETVRSCLDSYAADLRILFEDRLLSGPSRALALAASALPGSDRASIAFAANALAAIAGEEADPSVLRGPSLDQRFASLETVLVEKSGAFANPRLGAAVLPFAWAQFPTWRAPIQAWLDQLVRPQRLGDDMLAVLLPRLLNFASATGAAELITVRAASIAGPGSGTRLRRELAAGLLLAGAIDPAIGQQVRRQLWQWSYHRSGVPISLQRTVAQVCGDPDYAIRFPRNALTRLKHLLKSDSPSVVDDSLLSFASAARSLPPQTVVEPLAEWTAQDAEFQPIAPAVLIALLEDDGVRSRWAGDWLARDPSGSVTSMWRALLASASPSAVRDSVAAWLAFAASALPEHRTPLVERVAAAAGDFWTLGQLSQAVSGRSWSGRAADPDVLVLCDQLADFLTQAKVSM
ncbi:hypothetical protein [Glycomyces sp. NPDC048151]|uniref:hypothetical protein n=1 Tax=Glycomyces sp. NPDC048151 TaxID=3364002 RepID=UPI003716DA11